MPYIYKGEINGVKVRLIVGLIGPTPTDDELEEELDLPRNRGEQAGWTIICNDRVVVYGDKTPLSGWGEENVPCYHSQFSAIYGVVEFESLDSMKLPLTTTKDLNPSSDIYRLVKKLFLKSQKVILYWFVVTNGRKNIFQICQNLIQKIQNAKSNLRLCSSKYGDLPNSCLKTKRRRFPKSVSNASIECCERSNNERRQFTLSFKTQ
ncbi:hypothetical protein PN36_29330 [Candidatus Thiomargarita nelsonii]|uniref:Uncharacterized protein n=1 Tax=Candidatus Thiomargarita nelsonii TaxID=1003181 RepID=A0A4E0QZ46_9GAMM|nr:hypothetical protein PN36_29330 [Candidatus Thiomargarita nelsonii]